MKKMIRHSNLHLVVLTLLTAVAALYGCARSPMLHLHDDTNVDVDLPIIDLSLNVYWNYELDYGIHYDWRKEWYYGWDAIDSTIFGDVIGYNEPFTFQLRRYYTDYTAYGKHRYVLTDLVHGKTHRGQYTWGFWDVLVWNEIETEDGIQNINIDEQSSLDIVNAYTNETMHAAYYNHTRSHSFYQPEQLFAAYERAIEIDRDMTGFIYDPEKRIYYKDLVMNLEPLTYIYLVQIILHNNKGKVQQVDGSANLSGMSRQVCMNDGMTGSEPITIYYNVRLKRHCNMKGEDVDIIGGRLQTFGMCNLNPNRINSRTNGFMTRVNDGTDHYIDVNMMFLNGKDSTYVFNVTDQVQRLYKGGVLTVEIDCDTLKIPTGVPGSGFDAMVQEYQDGGTHEIEM